MLKSIFSKQFLLFCFVGLSCALINIIVRAIFDIWTSFGMSILIGFCFGVSLAFILNYLYVFPGSNKPIRNQIKGFLFTNLFFLPIVWISSIFLKSLLITIDNFSNPELYAHVIAVSIPLIFTFLIYKFSVFK